MKCFNLTSGKLIADKLTLKDTFFGRLVGLIATKSLKDGEGVILKPCSQIHTFFMRFVIDVIFVSRDYSVIKVIKNMKTWRISPLLPSSYYTVELPAGGLKDAVKEGDRLEFRQ